MSEAILILLIYFGLLAAFISVISAGILKWLDRRLTFFQWLLIAFVAHAIGLVFYILYFFAERQFAIPKGVAGLVALVWSSIVGSIITRQARTYGVEKTGWLGVGGKSILYLIFLSWVLTIIGLIIAAMTGRL